MPSRQHLYFDTSNLNAEYDYTPPLQGLGAGSLGSAGLGSLGATSLGDDATDFPWREESSHTRELQQVINEALDDAGYCPITVDGKLGPATCGAMHFVAEYLEMEESPPSTCESFTAPQKKPCGGGGAALPTTPDFTTRAALQPRSGSGGTNYLLIGGIVAAVAIGGAIVLKKKKGR